MEASKAAPVVVAKIDLKKYEKNRTPQYFFQDACKENRKEFKATSEWQYEKSAEFSEIRLRTEKEKQSFLKANPNKKKIKFVSILIFFFNFEF